MEKLLISCFVFLSFPYEGQTFSNSSFNDCAATPSWECQWSGMIILYNDRKNIYTCFPTLRYNPCRGSCMFCQADEAINEVKELIRVRDYIFNQLAIKIGHTVEKACIV